MYISVVGIKKNVLHTSYLMNASEISGVKLVYYEVLTLTPLVVHILQNHR